MLKFKNLSNVQKIKSYYLTHYGIDLYPIIFETIQSGHGGVDKNLGSIPKE
ncbi:MAG: hypothetical protein VXY75_04480 [Bacteroidota bacterium]|nr:hypothetical protein [Bacteroidota bacterium]